MVGPLLAGSPPSPLACSASSSARLTLRVQVHLTVPFTRTTFSTTASFEVRSPKRLQLRLTKGGIQVRGRGSWNGIGLERWVGRSVVDS